MKTLSFLLFGIFLANVSSLLSAQTIVKGRVIFDGTPPVPEKVEVKSDVPTCGSEKELQKIILGSDNGVANVVVKIMGAPGKPEPQTGNLNQENCEFLPHVQVLTLGSTLNISSSDPVLHNSHGINEDGTTAFNIAVPFAGIEVPVTLEKAGIIHLRCDAGHTWMNGYIVVTDVPYYGLTDINGNFSIANVPAGNYEIEVWQEWLGSLRQTLVVQDGSSEPLTITLRENQS